MPIQTKVIAVEGIDGVGKSTFCTLLCEKMKSASVITAKTPHGELNQLTDLARKQGKIAAFCAYMLSNIVTVSMFSGYEWLILDRYLLSTIVYHHEVFSLLEPSLRASIFTALKKPHHTILLTADIDVVEKRLLERQELSPNRNQLSSELQTRFQDYITDPQLMPMLGDLIIVKSNSLSDQQNTLKLVVQKLGI